jgi:hypothetical protein
MVALRLEAAITGPKGKASNMISGQTIPIDGGW